MPGHRWIPTREHLMAKPWLAPLRPWLADDRLWQMDRPSVARGVAIGLFIGLLLPVAQFFFAMLIAVVLRGHIAVSAACTLVTNPLTFTPIYWVAYQIGGRLLPPKAVQALHDTGAGMRGWLAQATDWLHSSGPTLLTGLLVLACAAAAAGYALVWLLWRQETHGATR
jgi:uncharacterized protein (DUF2062 family)